MISDCSVHVGATHAICQDYAKAGHTLPTNEPFVIVADGCSGEADTDVGARLLTLTAMEELQYDTGNMCSLEAYHTSTLGQAATCAKLLRLPLSCLASTLITLKLHGKTPFVAIYGDGLAAYKAKAGAIRVRQMFFPGSIPRYLSYKLNPQLKHEFDAHLRSYDIMPDGSIANEDVREHPGDYYYEIIEEEIDYVVVMSDGVGSFQQMVDRQTSKVQEPVDVKDVLKELLKFKNFAPGFLGRRMKRFLKDAAEKKWQHHDDFTVGALANEG